MGRRDHPGRVTSARRAESRRRLTDGVIFIRPFVLADCDATYLRWLRDPEVTRFLKFPTVSLQEARRYVVRAVVNPNARFFAICLPAGRKIGTIKLAPVDWQNGTAEVGVMVGARHVWGRGYGTRAVVLACRWAFERLALDTVTAGIELGNVASVIVFERAGFMFRKKGGVWRCLKRRP